MSDADASRPREEADKADRVEERQKTTKQNKQTENSQEEEDEQYEQELVFDSETEASCDLETGEEKAQDDLIPMPATGGAEALGCTPCDLSYEPAGGARA